MLENGLLLGTFANKYLDDLDKELLELYDKVINQPSNDWDLYYWMIGSKPTPEEYDNTVMDMLKNHAKNEQRDVRLRQPDLKQTKRQ
jgi:succinate dehydrogenase assembly factor 2